MKQWIKHQAHDAGEQILSHKDRGLNNLRSFGAHNAYNKAYNTAKTASARQLMDSKVSRKSLRTMKKVSHHLKRYTPEKITSIGVKFQGNTKKLNKHYSKLAHQFEKDLTDFRNAFTSFMRAIYDEITLALQELSADNKEVVALLNSYKIEIQKQGGYVPKEIIDLVEKGIDHLTHEEEHDAKAEAREDNKLMNDGHVKKGLGFALFGPNYAVGHVKSLFKKNETQEIRDARKNLKEMQNQIERHMTRITWLEHFRQHVDNLEIIAKHQRSIAHDLLLLLDYGKGDYDEIVQSAETFIGALGNEDALRNSHVANRLEEMKKVHDAISQFLAQKRDAEKTMFKEAKNLHSNCYALLDEIKKYSEKRMEEIRQGKLHPSYAQ